MDHLCLVPTSANGVCRSHLLIVELIVRSNIVVQAAKVVCHARSDVVKDELQTWSAGGIHTLAEVPLLLRRYSQTIEGLVQDLGDDGRRIFLDARDSRVADERLFEEPLEAGVMPAIDRPALAPVSSREIVEREALVVSSEVPMKSRSLRGCRAIYHRDCKGLHAPFQHDFDRRVGHAGVDCIIVWWEGLGRRVAG